MKEWLREFSYLWWAIPLSGVLAGLMCAFMLGTLWAVLQFAMLLFGSFLS